MATLNNVSLHTSMQIWSFLVKSFMAYMTMLDREVVAMTHRQIRGQMEVMLEADGFYFKFGMEMSSKTAFWFLFGMNISNTIHFMLFLRKKWKCADSIYTPCKSFFKVEPLSHGNIPLPPTHTPRYMVHNLSCSGSLSPIPSYWFDPLKKPLFYASFHRENTHKKVSFLVVVPLRSAPSPSGSYFFRQFFPLVKKWCFA